MNKDELIEKILRRLESQGFADFYNGLFEQYLSSDLVYEKNITHMQAREMIKQKIAELFDIK